MCISALCRASRCVSAESRPRFCNRVIKKETLVRRGNQPVYLKTQKCFNLFCRFCQLNIPISRTSITGKLQIPQHDTCAPNGSVVQVVGQNAVRQDPSDRVLYIGFPETSR